MKYLNYILFFLSILISGEALWGQDSNVYCKRRDLLDIEYVKYKLLEQNSTNFDNLNSPDSISIVKLEMENLFLTQSFYGSGKHININLIWVDSISIKNLDTLYCFWADDLFSPFKIYYNDTLNWFTYIDEGSGTNHYSETNNFIRIENKRFNNLLSIQKYVSDINPEESPWTYTSLKTTEIVLTQKTIVVKARFESGRIEKDESNPIVIKEDIATFEFSDLCKCFNWSKSTNKEFEKFWKGEIDYSEL